MAWIDIVVGAVIGLLIALALSHVFITRPKTTIVIVILFALLGITLSDDYITPSDSRWNVVEKIKHFIQLERHQTEPAKNP